MSSSLVLSGMGLNDPTTSAFIPSANILGKKEEIISKKRNGFCLASHERDDEDVVDESSESSSIGADSSSTTSSEKNNDGDEDEVQSDRKEASFISLDSIEESLPIKRGLSNFFAGKSKSFASLSDMSNAAATDLAKSENPFNKRRRILMASKMRRASYSSLISTYLPPLFCPDNAVLEENEEEEEKGIGSSVAPSTDNLPIKNRKIEGMKKAFRSPRSFSLSDLQHA